MLDKTQILERSIAAKLQHLGDVHRCGDMNIDPLEIPLGVWISVQGNPPQCNRQELTVTYYIRSHADSDKDRQSVDAKAAAVIDALEHLDLAPDIPDAAILPPSSSVYAIEDGFHIITLTQTIHIREV
jgi:hypothetical protein